ncbi:MAG: GNAT family N-acetyltransferase [Lachnospiraceae bacterium]|nr:GNAT family N-acetyltransferase [Lachnospiraceae bacterium]
MEQKEFDKAKENADHFKYQSMMYTDYEEVMEYKIERNDEKGVILFGKDEETGFWNLLFAVNEAEDLLSAIPAEEKGIRLSFVPESFVPALKQAGFVTYAVWNDYFKMSLNDVVDDNEGELLTEEECRAASDVTKSCAGQSRGFTGQSEEWFQKWINASEISGIETGTKDNAVFIYKADGQIAGIVCTAVYGHESKKGPTCWIREVAVRKEYQNQGIARRLIGQALSYGKKHGATRAFLHADECNTGAIHLYKSIGFEAKADQAEINMVR